MAELTDGRYGDIAIGPHLDASGILLGGSERPFDQLSVGTQEQIALLLRLSIAEALKSFLVLDDHLTQTDDGRMTWIRQLLERSSGSTQVIVLTCHPEHYRSKGQASVNTVDLQKVIRRNGVKQSGSTPAPRPTAVGTSADLEPGPTTPSQKAPPTRAGRSAKRGDAGPDLSEMLRRSLEKRK